MAREANPYDYMLEVILPQCVEQFRYKSADYGPEAFMDLGYKGQFSDMWRKMLKLKRVMWNGVPLEFEQADEILKDLFGHILISLYLMEDPINIDDNQLWDDTGRCATSNTPAGKRCRLSVHPESTPHLFS